MATRIHPTAIVESAAEIGEGVEIGAYAFVGAGVRLGEGVVLHHHATIEGDTEIGPECEVFPYACLGLRTQDLKYQGGRPGLRVGARNVFREFATVHAATNDGDHTVIGDDNHLLAYSHVAHDCVLGNRIIASNNATFAGHVRVGDHAVIGGLAAIHQFCQIGAYSMIGGCAKVIQDIPPYCIGDGHPAVVRTFNKVGLERAGFTPEQISRVKGIYRIFYREGLNRTQAAEKLAAEPDAANPEAELFLDFVAASQRGLSPGA